MCHVRQFNNKRTLWDSGSLLVHLTVFVVDNESLRPCHHFCGLFRVTVCEWGYIVGCRIPRRGLGESGSGVIELTSRYLLGEAEEILEYLQARRPIFKRRCEPRTLLLHIYSPIARPRNPCPVHCCCCCCWAWRHVLETVVERILADAVRGRRTRTNPLHCLHKYCRFSQKKSSDIKLFQNP